MQVRILGEIAAERDGRTVAVLGPQVRRLFALLVSDAGRTVSIERMVDVLFADGLAEASRIRNARTYLYRLRGMLGDGAVETTPTGYRLQLGRDAIDADRFGRLVARAESGDLVERLGALDDAFSLWPSGRAFGEFADEDWCRAQAVGLEELRLHATELRIDARLGLGEHDSVLSELEALVRDHPLRQHFHVQLMTALHRCGRQAEALRVAHEYRAFLAEETGLDPGPQVIELERQIGRNDSALAFVAGEERRQLRGYVLRERIGGGAFGSVFRAVQPSVEREVAVKVVRSELADDPWFVRRFEAEAQLVAGLEHAHIVPLYDYWREPGGAYIVMRYLRGGSAEDRLRTGPLPLAQVSEIVASIGGALAAAHGRGVVHRDVKPANILFDEHGDVYLVDFGIAVSRVGGLSTISWPGDATNDPSADQAALATTVWQLLAGIALLASPIGEQSVPLGRLGGERHDLPPAVDDLLAKATAHIATDRFADVGDFVAAWQRATASAAIQPGVGAGLDRHEPRHPQLPVNPYKGLRAFGEAEAADFFGRADLTAEIASLIDVARFVAVVGPSGSGKSSVVHAGLVPRLRAKGAFVVAMMPGVHPFDEFAVALRRVATDPRVETGEQLRATGRVSRAIRRAVPADDADVVVVIDQFEELWTRTASVERSEFLSAIGDLVNDPEGVARVVVTLRADFYDRPLLDPSLGPLTRANTIVVTPLTAVELYSAITEPSHHVGVQCEPALVAGLIADVSAQPGSLPLLQYALTDLFERRVDGVLTEASYRAAGGLTGVLVGRAEELCERHDPLAVRRLFTRLVTPGDGVPDTRRRVPRSELAGLDDSLIDDFAQRRLLTFDRDPNTREPTVEVAHEALLQSWPRLAAWLTLDRQDLRTHRHLTDASRAWNERGRDASELYRGGRLEAARRLAEAQPDNLNPIERAFVAAATARASRNRRLGRGAVTLLVVLALIAAVTAGVALAQRRRANRAAAVAAANAARADTEASQARANSARANSAAAAAQQSATVAEAAKKQEHTTAVEAQIRRLAHEGRELAVSQPAVGLLLAAEAYQRLPHDVDTQGGLQAAILANPYLAAILPGGASPHRISSRITKAGVVATMTDTAIRVTDTTTRTSRTLPGDFRQAPGIELWPDDHTAAIAVGDTLRLIDIADGHDTTPPLALPSGKLNVLLSPPIPQHDLALLPDGRLILDTSNGFAIVSPDLHIDQVAGVITPAWLRGPAVASKVPVIVEGSFIGSTLEVIDLRDSTPPRTFDLATSNLNIWAVNADGTRIVGGSGTGEVVVIDRSGTTVARRRVPDAVVGLTYLADGRLAITTINGVLTLADPNTLEPFITISLPALALTGPVFATDGRHAVADLYQELAVLDLAGRSALAAVAPGFTAAALSPDGHRVAAITTDGGTIVLGAKSLAPLAGPWQSPDIPPGVGYSVTWAPDGHRFAVRGPTPPGHSPSIELVDAQTGQVDLVPVAAPSVFGSTMSFTPDGHRLVVPDEFAGVELIDLATKQQLAKGVDPNWGPATDAAINPNGTRLALNTFDKEALLDTTTLQQLTPCDIQAGFAAWSTDGNRLAVGTHSGDVVIADPNCRPQLTLAGSHAHPTVRFSADGTQVFARDLDGTRIWDLQTARQIGAAFPDPNGTNGAFGVTATGELFSMAPSDQQLLLFDLDPDHWLADACTIAGRNLTTDEWNRYLGTLGPYRRTCPQNPSQP